MESPSLLLCKGLLLTASLLTCWNSPTWAAPQRSTKEMQLSAAEGGKVLFSVPIQTKNVLSFHWFKGKDEFAGLTIARYEKDTDLLKFGNKSSGREQIYKDGSMMLQDVTQEDTGIYSLEILGEHYTLEITHFHLQVYKIVTQPYLKLNHTRVMRRRSAAIITCVSPDTDIDVNWFFNYKPINITERTTVSPEERKLIITPFWRTDAGIYQCEVSNSFSFRRSNPLLLVLV